MQCYELLETLQIIIAKKFIDHFQLKDVYKALFYVFLHVSLEKLFHRHDLIAPLKDKIPPPLSGIAINELSESARVLLTCIEKILSSKSPVLVDSIADLNYVIRAVKQEVKTVDYVIIYDCMSILEQLIISAFLRKNRIDAFFLSKIYVNPLGLTKFVTQQLHEIKQGSTLTELARYFAKELKAKSYRVSPLIDKVVHEMGSLGIEEFVDSVDIDRIALDTLDVARKGSLLLLSDHGYDIVAPPNLSYLYVVHGFKRESFRATPILILSKIFSFLGTR